jgi:hypothetical protein
MKLTTYLHLVLRVFFYYYLWGGVRLSPLGMSATSGPIAPAVDDNDDYRAVGGMRIGMGN